MIPSDLAAILRAGCDVRVDDARQIIGGGDECVVWHVTPEPYVVRVAPVWRTCTELTWAYEVAFGFASDVPEVVCAIPSTGGDYVVDWAGSPVSLWPYVEGDHADREDPAIRAQAADLLARLHSAAHRLPAPDRRPAQPRNIAPPDADDIRDPVLDQTLSAWRRDAASAWPRGALHGDYYRGNLLVRNGTIAGLIDWDEARYDWLVTELAWATWEFGKAPGGDDLMPDRAAAFLAGYARAGGPAYPRELIVPLIREHLRAEIRRSRAAAVAGEPVSAAYEAAEVRAFATLAGPTACLGSLRW